eukprot:2198408-Prymnesium_polylepis.1
MACRSPTGRAAAWVPTPPPVQTTAPTRGLGWRVARRMMPSSRRGKQPPLRPVRERPPLEHSPPLRPPQSVSHTIGDADKAYM